MCAGMSISVVGAHLSTDATFTWQRGRTAVREISLQVLWRSNRVQHLEVIFGHVQVAEGEVLGSLLSDRKARLVGRVTHSHLEISMWDTRSEDLRVCVQ
jgi:hypothetical protein